MRKIGDKIYPNTRREHEKFYARDSRIVRDDGGIIDIHRPTVTSLFPGVKVSVWNTKQDNPKSFSVTGCTYGLVEKIEEDHIQVRIYITGSLETSLWVRDSDIVVAWYNPQTQLESFDAAYKDYVTRSRMLGEEMVKSAKIIAALTE